MTKLRFLIDTNVAIPLEPSSPADVSAMSSDAAVLQEFCQRAGIGLYLHPATRHDVLRDANGPRRKLRELLFGKYPKLQDPPPISLSLTSVIGDAVAGSNDWVDHCLLEAIKQACAHFLVSEDRDLHRKARRLGLTNVVLIREALAIVRRLFDRDVEPPPAVEDLHVYALDRTDPIFDSFRTDYPGFDGWLKKCCEAHRKAWVIRRDGAIAAFSIYKPEDGLDVGLSGSALKLCSFKVADQYRGLAYGELLLRSAYAFARENGFSWLYLTAFEERQPFLMDFLDDLGFEPLDRRTGLGEAILAKPVGWRQELPEIVDPAAFLRRYGPFSFERVAVESYIIPIQPQYHSILFPDAELQRDMFAGHHYFGNAIRKAYLCNAAIRTLKPGDLLFFYESQGAGTIQVAGVLEHVLVSVDAAEVASFVGKRTVYSFAEMEKMADGREIVALLFMAVKMTGRSVHYDDLVEGGILNGPPQSIQSIPKGKMPWLLTQLQL